MKKEVKVRAHDRTDGSHVRQHSRTVDSAASYENELPPEGREGTNPGAGSASTVSPKSGEASGRRPAGRTANREG